MGERRETPGVAREVDAASLLTVRTGTPKRRRPGVFYSEADSPRPWQRRTDVLDTDQTSHHTASPTARVDVDQFGFSRADSSAATDQNPGIIAVEIDT